MFLMWLGEQITSRGIGNGTSLIIFAGIVAELPAPIVGPSSSAPGRDLDRADPRRDRHGGCVIAFIVFMERAQRRLLINYPKRQVGNRVYEGQTSFLPLKLNTSGVIPPIFASSLLLLPTTIASFCQPTGSDRRFRRPSPPISGTAGRSTWSCTSALIVFFGFFYTAIVFNPVETADNLKKHGGFMPGIRPGERTADYIDYVLTRITVRGRRLSGARVPLTRDHDFLCILPFYFGGTSLLIVVSVTMDTVAQVHGHLLAHQYEGLVKKAKLGGKPASMRLILLGPRGGERHAGGATGQAAHGIHNSPPATCCARPSPPGRRSASRPRL